MVGLLVFMSIIFFILFVTVAISYIINQRAYMTHLDECKNLRSIFLNQETVNKILSERSQKLDNACKQEVNLQREQPLGSGMADPNDPVEKSEKVINGIQVYIQHRKEEFWEAHGLAKQYGIRTGITCPNQYFQILHLNLNHTPKEFG